MPAEEPDDESTDEKWVRIHPEDRLWLAEEILRLTRKRYKETNHLKRPSIQDTLGSLFDELRDARERLEEMLERTEWLESRLARCGCDSSLDTFNRDAHSGHQPGPANDDDGTQRRGRRGARLL